jgi:hypothetical protein
LRMLPKLAVNQIVARAAFAGFCGDVMQDFDVWQNKRYVHPPVLATGDGPVIRYRRWARQFYPAQAGVRGGSPDALTQPDQD